MVYRITASNNRNLTGCLLAPPLRTTVMHHDLLHYSVSYTAAFTRVLGNSRIPTAASGVGDIDVHTDEATLMLEARLQGAVLLGRAPGVARALTAMVPGGGEWILPRAQPVQVHVFVLHVLFIIVVILVSVLVLLVSLVGTAPA